jgi:hypothetical protein
MIAAMLPVEEASQDLHVRYSRALATADWVILMRRPEESASGTGILAPFDVNVTNKLYFLHLLFKIK